MAISRSKVKIWIVPTGTNGVALALTGTTSVAPISGEIQSYSKSGGELDVESVPVFGGFVSKDKPRSQVELSFEIIPDVLQTARFESYAYAKNTDNRFVYSQDPTDKAVFIQAQDGSSYLTYAFNNVNVVSFDFDHSADDNRTATLNFKFSPTNESGVSNLQADTVVVTSLTAWSVLAV
jgi:hypothetical protein